MYQARDGVKKATGYEKRVVYDTDALDLDAEVRRVRDDMDAFGDVVLCDRVEGEKVGAFVVDVELDISTTLPDDTAVLIHPDATAPLPPGVSDPSRPWLVRFPEGVVVVETGGDE